MEWPRSRKVSARCGSVRVVLLRVTDCVAIFCILAVSMRLKSVKNIQKITKSMKMVSAAKFTRAERELKPARVFGTGANGKNMAGFAALVAALGDTYAKIH